MYQLKCTIMKKVYLFLLGFIFSAFVYGQEENRRPYGKSYSSEKGHNKEIHTLPLQQSGHWQLNQPFLKNGMQELQRLDSLLGYEIDGEEEHLDYKEEYSYNENDLISRYQAYYLDELTGEWVLDDREVYEYNEAGSLVLFYDFDFDSLSQQWFEAWVREYVYDENNLLVQIFESWKDAPGEEWYFVWREDYTYNENNRLSSRLHYIHTIGWAVSQRSEYIYDDDGNLVRYELYDDDDAGEWINEALEEYMYDDNNRLVEFIDYDWDESAEEWVGWDREIYSYSDNNNVEFYVDYNWSETDTGWVEFWREEFTYNNDYPYDQLVLPWFYQDNRPNFMNHQLVEYQGNSFVESGWIPFSRGEYYYSSEPSTSVADIKSTGVMFYPNPASTHITFRFDSPYEALLQVYDLTGHLVHSAQVRKNKPVNIRQLSDGLYLFRLTGEDNMPVFSEKIIVK